MLVDELRKITQDALKPLPEEVEEIFQVIVEFLRLQAQEGEFSADVGEIMVEDSPSRRASFLTAVKRLEREGLEVTVRERYRAGFLEATICWSAVPVRMRPAVGPEGMASRVIRCGIRSSFRRTPSRFSITRSRL